MQTVPGYQVRLDSISIGNTNFQIQSLKDRQQYSDPDGLAEKLGISSANWPLFGMIWPSEIILAELMSTVVTDNCRILELGCGIGIASLVASSRGANITASDYHPLSQPFLNENIVINALPQIKYLFGDWRKPITGAGKFDLIIGSDLLYERDHPELLSTFIHCHAADNAKIIIVDPGRRHANQFTKLMSKLGYECYCEILKPRKLMDKEYKGKILTYQAVGSANATIQ